MVGLLIIAHDCLGKALLDTAAGTLGYCPLATEVLSITRDADPDGLAREALAMAERLDQGGGVLVLTDMYGSTPSNIACTLLDHSGVRVVAGVNLPMLIRVFNYAALDLSALTDKALTGGHDGVVACALPSTQQVRHG